MGLNNMTAVSEILLYSPVTSSRLKYITGIMLGDLLGLSLQITTDEEVYRNYTGPRICYHTRQIAESGCLIGSSGLLNERGINPHQLNLIDYTGSKALFPVYGKDVVMPFDVFSAAFYVVSRYEEYLPYIRDAHGRFSAFSSLAWQKGFLQVPVVNVWAKELGKILTASFPELQIKEPVYNYIPTIDIDAAWAYGHKGFYRSLGGFLKDIYALDPEGLKTRFRCLLKLEKDPFDTFELMHSLHHKYHLSPKFFILFADYDQYDKNTPIYNVSFQKLVKGLSDEGEVGIHPSYASNTIESSLGNEIEALSGVLHREVTSSRQHFLKLQHPDTYRNLLSHDITDDYTMGFAAQTGFRSGMCTTYKWYDLEMERITGLRIHPFAVMDGTLGDYMEIDANSAMHHIRPLVDVVRSVGGTFISLWHNESLANWRRWKGWDRVYEEMLDYAKP